MRTPDRRPQSAHAIRPFEGKPSPGLNLCHFSRPRVGQRTPHAPHGGRGKTSCRLLCPELARCLPQSRRGQTRVAIPGPRLASSCAPLGGTKSIWEYFAGPSAICNHVVHVCPIFTHRSATAPTRFSAANRERFRDANLFELPPQSIRTMSSGIDGAALERFSTTTNARWKDNGMRDEISARRACDFILTTSSVQKGTFRADD